VIGNASQQGCIMQASISHHAEPPGTRLGTTGSYSLHVLFLSKMFDETLMSCF